MSDEHLIGGGEAKQGGFFGGSSSDREPKCESCGDDLQAGYCVNMYCDQFSGRAAE